MSTPIVRYKYIEEVEVLEDYRPGGYHPVQINDTLRHDRYQIVHKPGHDLHLGNLLLRLPASLNNLSIDQLYAKFGAPKLKPIARLDGDDISLCDAKLLLSDFGVAFRPADKTKCESNAPLVVRPPESYFEPTKPLTFESGIWSLSCLIFELFAHRSLIDGIIAPQDDITAQQWDKRSKWFDNKGQALSNEQDIWSWDRRFRQWIQEPRKSEGMETINSEEAAALLDLLKRMLAWKPENRPQAQQILESGWVKEWALPAYNKTKRTPEVERA
ncbi:hypothetical protein FOFC_17653 [Fusarium oxysporum]|nr:hypothetical protein FOFC_17653 [Fusarium oxysporum]